LTFAVPPPTPLARTRRRADRPAALAFAALLGKDGSFRLVGIREELRSGLESSDAESVRRAAHTLKSDAATFGASALAEVCAELEATARSADLAGGEALLRQIETTYASVEAGLTKLRAQLA
jgi:HPt (histidine-containing phosphotransfer) domain-containing protein